MSRSHYEKDEEAIEATLRTFDEFLDARGLAMTDDGHVYKTRNTPDNIGRKPKLVLACLVLENL